MAEASYEKRIADAELEREASRAAREQCYPGSPEWDRHDAKVAEWNTVIADLRRAAAS